MNDSGHLIPLEQPARVTRVITTFAQKYRPVDVPTRALRDYVGEYAIRGRVGEVLLIGDRLILRLPDERDTPLFSQSAGQFFALSATLPRLEFVRNAAQRVVEVDISEQGKTERCPRIS